MTAHILCARELVELIMVYGFLAYFMLVALLCLPAVLALMAREFAHSDRQLYAEVPLVRRRP